MRRALLPSTLCLLAACRPPAIPLPAAPLAPRTAPLAPRPGSAGSAQAAAAPLGSLPLDPRDGGPLLLGPTTREAILAHRASFRDPAARADLAGGWKAAWQTFDTPVVLVVAFGSWCGDSQREMADLLALDALGSPFITVRYFGVARDKRSQATDWPAGIPPRPVEHVPTLWLYAPQPGGGMKFIDAIVENPPKKGQRMGEAVLEMLGKAR